MMNKKISFLIKEASLVDNHETILDALTNLGLLLERHTQYRYSESSYLSLFGNDDELFNLRLSNNDVDEIIYFLFYHIINIHIHPVTVAWCFGKCYDCRIYQGILNLLRLFNKDDDICEQLLFSLNALYDPMDTFKDIVSILEDSIKEQVLPKTEEIIKSNFNLIDEEDE